MEMKTINQWLKQLGYKWVEGREEFMKSELSANQANNEISRLYAEGAIKCG